MLILTLHPALTILVTVSLAAAVWRDATKHRIDNWITFPGAMLAVGLQIYFSGPGGAVDALVGLVVGLAVLMPFYVLHGMAAGDVKLMAAIGACLGPSLAFWAAAYALIAGAVLAAGVLAIRGELGRGVTHMSRQAWAYAWTRVWVPGESTTVLAQRFPYATAIAAGVCLLAVVGTPVGI